VQPDPSTNSFSMHAFFPHAFIINPDFILLSSRANIGALPFFVLKENMPTLYFSFNSLNVNPMIVEFSTTENSTLDMVFIFFNTVVFFVFFDGMRPS